MMHPTDQISTKKNKNNNRYCDKQQPLKQCKLFDKQQIYAALLDSRIDSGHKLSEDI